MHLLSGAGLSLSAFLPSSAELVELFTYDRPSTNRHYHNICKWTRHGYKDVLLPVSNAENIAHDGFRVVAEAVWSAIIKFL